ncbi:MAG: helix-turn-helix transcriptional regulator [Lachnospiraceae bacterium]|nr:helix-turn-helix transcriptional regulator [Lachnospiraceae bacterium]
MTENERVKAIRRSERVNLTLEKFGERVVLKKSSLSLIENGKSTVTEQLRRSICREFGVDYAWLTTGEGQMFAETDDDMAALIDRVMAGENEFHKELFKTFARLDTEELLALERILDMFIQEHVKNQKSIDEKVNDYRRELNEEKEAGEGSSASQTANAG